MERIETSASCSRACLPEVTAPGGAKASNQFSALDPGRADTSLQELICGGPAWHECSSHADGHKYRTFFACSWSLAPVPGTAGRIKTFEPPAISIIIQLAKY